MNRDIAAALYIISSAHTSELLRMSRSLVAILGVEPWSQYRSFRAWLRRISGFHWHKESYAALRRSPKTWGPYLWRMMRLVALGASRPAFLEFLHALQPMLPCARCSRNMLGHLARMDPSSEPPAMVQFLYDAVKRSP